RDLGGEALLVAHERVVRDLHVLDAEDDAPVAQLLLGVAIAAYGHHLGLGGRARAADERHRVLDVDPRVGGGCLPGELLGRLRCGGEARAALEGRGRRRRFGRHLRGAVPGLFLLLGAVLLGLRLFLLLGVWRRRRRGLGLLLLLGLVAAEDAIEEL